MPNFSELPHPIDIVLDPVSLVAIGIYLILIAWEFAFPARSLPQVRAWQVKGLLGFGAYFFLSSYLPLLWDASMSAYQLFDLSASHLALQVAGAILAYEVIAYAYHQALHSSDLLWRVFHQMHHSAERLDTFGAFWFNPLDAIGFTLMGSLAMVLVVGISPQAATIALLFLFFCAVFQHSNIKTPRWLGYFIQRPESHSYHHGQGLHRHNYADLPIIDIIFGTFRNPKDFYQTGFYQGASSRVWEMLTFRRVDEVTKTKPELTAVLTN